jgi:hypothetical protein
MIRPRNIDPGQYPHPNALITGLLMDNAVYWVAAGQSVALATAPAGTTITLAAAAVRPLPLAQSVSITVAGTTTNGDMTIRVRGVNQFNETIQQDFVLPSGTAAGVITPAANLITTKVFRKVTSVQMLANANTAAATISVGTTSGSAQFKIGIPVKIARVSETVRFQHFVALVGANNLLGVSSVVDLSNHAIFVGSIAAAGGTLCIFQLDLNVNTGQRG